MSTFNTPLCLNLSFVFTPHTCFFAYFIIVENFNIHFPRNIKQR